MSRAYRDKPARRSPHAAQLAARLVGRTIDDAEVIIETIGLRYRTVRIDGHDCPVTRDVRDDRIGLSVTHGIVVAAEVG